MPAALQAVGPRKPVSSGIGETSSLKSRPWSRAWSVASAGTASRGSIMAKCLPMLGIGEDYRYETTSVYGRQHFQGKPETLTGQRPSVNLGVSRKFQVML